MASVYDSERVAAAYAFDRPRYTSRSSGQFAWPGRPIRPWM